MDNVDIELICYLCSKVSKIFTFYIIILLTLCLLFVLYFVANHKLRSGQSQVSFDKIFLF